MSGRERFVFLSKYSKRAVEPGGKSGPCYGGWLPALGEERETESLPSCFKSRGKSGTGLNTVRAHSTSQLYTQMLPISLCVS